MSDDHAVKVTNLNASVYLDCKNPECRRANIANVGFLPSSKPKKRMSRAEIKADFERRLKAYFKDHPNPKLVDSILKDFDQICNKMHVPAEDDKDGKFSF